MFILEGGCAREKREEGEGKEGDGEKELQERRREGKDSEREGGRGREGRRGEERGREGGRKEGGVREEANSLLEANLCQCIHWCVNLIRELKVVSL